MYKRTNALLRLALVLSIAAGPAVSDPGTFAYGSFGVLCTVFADPLNYQRRVYCAGNNDGAVGVLGSDANAHKSVLGVNPMTNAVVFAPPNSDFSMSVMVGGGRVACSTAQVKDKLKIRCWGGHSNGALGRKHESDGDKNVGCSGATCVAVSRAKYLPLDEPGLNLETFSVGYEHVCVLYTNGAVKCWGYQEDEDRRLGIFQDSADFGRTSNLPFVNFGQDDFALDSPVQITTGAKHSCVLHGGGTIRCWGSNEYGQLGLANVDLAPVGWFEISKPYLGGSTVSSVPPIVFSDTVPAVQVEASFGSTYAVFANGVVRAWGLNDVGQLGHGNVANVGQANGDMTTLAPVTFQVAAAVDPVVHISSQHRHVCAMFGSTKSIRCWGENTFGQLGADSNAPSIGTLVTDMPALGPVVIPPGLPIYDVLTAYDTTCALTSLVPSSGIYCWGNHVNSRLVEGGTHSFPVGTNANKMTNVKLVSTNPAPLMPTLLAFTFSPTVLATKLSGEPTVAIRGPPALMAEVANVRFTIMDGSKDTYVVAVTKVSSRRVDALLPPITWALRTPPLSIAVEVEVPTLLGYVETGEQLLVTPPPAYIDHWPRGFGYKLQADNFPLFSGYVQIFAAGLDVNTPTQIISFRPSDWTLGDWEKYVPCGVSSAGFSGIVEINCVNFPYQYRDVSNNPGVMDVGIVLNQHFTPPVPKRVEILPMFNLIYFNDTIDYFDPVYVPRNGGVLVTASGSFTDMSPHSPIVFCYHKALGNLISPAVYHVPAEGGLQLKFIAKSTTGAQGVSYPAIVICFVSFNEMSRSDKGWPVVYYEEPSVLAFSPPAVRPRTNSSITIFGLKFFDNARYTEATLELVGSGAPVIKQVITWTGTGGYVTQLPDFGVPVQMGLVKIEVTVDGTSYTSDGRILGLFGITDISPKGSILGAPAKINVYGDGFVNSGVSLRCLFASAEIGSVSSIAQFITRSHITCNVPAHSSPAQVVVEVTANGANYTDAGLTVQYYQPPAITSVTPLMFPTNAQPGDSPTVTIAGTGFSYLGVPYQAVIGLSTTTCSFVNGTNASTPVTVVACPVQGGVVGYSPLVLSLNQIDQSATGFRLTLYEIQQLSPSGGLTAGGTQVTVRGAGFTSPDVGCRFGTVETAAVVLSAAALSCVAPPSPLTGYVYLEVRVGSPFFTRDTKFYQYYNSPTISAISPVRGPSKGGTFVVTVSGSGFSKRIGDYMCRFGAIAVPSVGSSLLPEQIMCTSPDGSGTAVVEVSMNGGVDWTDWTVYHPAGPYELAYFSVDDVFPSILPSEGETIIVLSGAGFVQSGSSQCWFIRGSTTLKVAATVVNAARVECIAPLSAPDTTWFVEFSADGTTATADQAAITYFFPPTVTALVPNSGFNGVAVTVQGHNFTAGIEPRCMFGTDSVPATVTVPAGAAHLAYATCTAPPQGATAVPLEVSFNAGASYTDDASPFYYFAVLSSLPESGSVLGGTQLEVSGAGYSSAATLWCRFTRNPAPPSGTNGTIVPATFGSSAVIKCPAPPQPSPSDAIVEIGPDKVAWALPSIAFEFAIVPDVTLVNPQSGPASGGTTVVMTGTFPPSTIPLAVMCRFGLIRVTAASVTIDPVTGQGSVTCVAPSSSGTVDLLLSVNRGFDFFRVSDFSFFSLFSISATEGPDEGGTSFQVVGSGFVKGQGSSCRFNLTHVVPAVVISSGSALCETPASKVGTVPVQYSNSGSDWSGVNLQAMFTYFPSQRLAYVNPSTSPSAGSIVIVIGATNLPNTTASTSVSSGLVKCRFGDSVVDGWVSATGVDLGAATASTVQSPGLSDGEVSCVAPPGSGDAPLSISLNSGVTFSVSTLPFSYFSVFSASPTLGSRGIATDVTLTGTGFRSLMFQGNAAQCRFSSAIGVAKYLDDIRASCQVPDLPVGSHAIYLSLDSGGTWAPAHTNFTVIKEIQLGALTPTSGPSTAPFVAITIPSAKGTTFPGGADVVGSMCGFDGALVQAVVKDTSATCALPYSPDSAGPVDVFLTFNSQNFIKVGTYNRYLVISVSPGFVPVAGGTVITIEGAGFIPIKFTSDKAVAAGARKALAPICRFASGSSVIAEQVTPSSMTCRVPNLISVAAAKNRRRLGGGDVDFDADVDVDVDVDVDDKVNGGSGRFTALQTQAQAEAEAARTIRIPVAVAFEVVVNQGLGNEPDQIIEPPFDAGGSGKYYALSPLVGQSGSLLTVYQTPVVGDVIPASGPTSGGYEITLRGSGFVDSPLLRCKLGAEMDRFLMVGKFVSESEIRCPVQANIHGTVSIFVTFNMMPSDLHDVGAQFVYEKCPAGTSSKSFTEACVPCPRGFFAPEPGTRECLPCDAESYTDYEGAADCTPCPDNSMILGGDRDTVKQCLCKKGFYHPQSKVGEPCLPCPLGAACEGNQTVPYAVRGYWHTTETPNIFMKCDTPESCPGGPPNTCRGGYQGRLCAGCEPGTYQMGEVCEPCPGNPLWRWVMFGFFVFFISIMLIRIVGRNAQASGGIIGISTFFFQVLAMLNKLKLNWPIEVRIAIDIITIPFTFDVDLLASECAFPASYSTKYKVMFLIPVLYFLLYIFYYFVGISMLGMFGGNKKLTVNGEADTSQDGADLSASVSRGKNTLDYQIEMEITKGRGLKGVLNESRADEAAYEDDGGGANVVSPRDESDANGGGGLRATPSVAMAVQGDSLAVLEGDDKEVKKIRKRWWAPSNVSYRKVDVANRLVNAYFLFLSLTYLIPSTLSFELIDCTAREDGQWTLDASPSLLCYEPWWFELLPYAVFGMLTYAIIIPSSLAIFLVRNKHRQDLPSFIARYGSVFVDFKKEVAYWESILMVQKVLMLLPIMFFTTFPSFQISAFLLVLFLSLTTNLVVRPFFLERYNALQTVLRWCSCLMLLIGMAIRSSTETVVGGGEVAAGGSTESVSQRFVLSSSSVLLLGGTFFLLGIGVVSIIAALIFDVVVISAELRRRVDPSVRKNLNALTHPHGKTEMIQWLGRMGRGSVYAPSLRRVLTSVAWTHRRLMYDPYFSAAQTALDKFIDLYTGRVFTRPVIPSVRVWLVERMEGSDEQGLLGEFIEAFAAFGAFQTRLRASSRIFLRPEKPIDIAEVKAFTTILDNESSRARMEQSADLVEQLLCVEVLDRISVLALCKQLLRGDNYGLEALTRTYVGLQAVHDAEALQAVRRAGMDAILSGKAAKEKRRNGRSGGGASSDESWDISDGDDSDSSDDDDEITPYLEVLYEEMFAASAMHNVAKQVDGSLVKADFMLSDRSPYPYLHSCFSRLRTDRLDAVMGEDGVVSVNGMQVRRGNLSDATLAEARQTARAEATFMDLVKGFFVPGSVDVNHIGDGEHPGDGQVDPTNEAGFLSRLYSQIAFWEEPEPQQAEEEEEYYYSTEEEEAKPPARAPKHRVMAAPNTDHSVGVLKASLHKGERV